MRIANYTSPYIPRLVSCQTLERTVLKIGRCKQESVCAATTGSRSKDDLGLISLCNEETTDSQTQSFRSIDVRSDTIYRDATHLPIHCSRRYISRTRWEFWKSGNDFRTMIHQKFGLIHHRVVQLNCVTARNFVESAPHHASLSCQCKMRC